MSIQSKRGATTKSMVVGDGFHARFKGRTHLMNKEGHLGVVKSTEKPIVKGGGGSHFLEGAAADGVPGSGDHHFSRSRQSNMINSNFGINPMLSNGPMQTAAE